MLHSDDSDRFAGAVDDRCNSRDPLFPALALIAPLPINRRGACEPICERPVKYLCHLGTYGEDRHTQGASLEGLALTVREGERARRLKALDCLIREYEMPDRRRIHGEATLAYLNVTKP